MNFERADAINAAIRSVAIKHRAKAAGMLAAHGLHPGHEVILFALHQNGPQNQRRLAATADCEPPTMTAMLRNLEANDFVHREASTSDARAMVVSLTDKGQALIPALKDTWRQLAEYTVADLDESTTDTLVAVLAELTDSLRSRPAKSS